MTVKKLIERLEQLNPDAEVVVGAIISVGCYDYDYGDIDEFIVYQEGLNNETVRIDTNIV